MPTEGFKRKLTAIFNADVVDYSRLMADDESATVKTLETYKGVMSTLINEHRGRVVDSTGDNLLAEFGSVVDAVQCAVVTQKELQARNEELPGNRRMQFRIGINLGDVIEEKNRLYGDGVNIAARLEGLADPGGICISKTVFDQIENKLPLGYQFLGEQSVKNIAKPIGAYKVLMEPRVIGAEEKQEFKTVLSDTPPPLPDKPSIAVLPFDNLSKNPDQEYLADGITDQIITGLSMMPFIFVIARNSSFIYKGRPVKVQQVSQELGVQYVLEGSVQQAGNRIRVTAQLIDALTGRHVWSERYDRVLEDIFAVQDEIMLNIMQAMDVSIAGTGLLQDQPTPKSVEAYFKILKGLELIYHWNRDDNLMARKLVQEAIALDPEYGRFYEALGWTYHHEAMHSWSEDLDESLRRAEELGEKAITLGDTFGHMLLMNIYRLRGQIDKAVVEGEKALSFNQNYADLNALFGNTLSMSGRHEEAIERVNRAIRLNPHHPSYYFGILGSCYLRAGINEKANETHERIVQRDPNRLHPWLALAGIYAQMGRNEEAKKAAKEVRRIAPDYTWEKYGKPFYVGFFDKEVERQFFDGLRKVGLM